MSKGDRDETTPPNIQEPPPTTRYLIERLRAIKESEAFKSCVTLLKQDLDAKRAELAKPVKEKKPFDHERERKYEKKLLGSGRRRKGGKAMPRRMEALAVIPEDPEVRVKLSGCTPVLYYC